MGHAQASDVFWQDLQSGLFQLLWGFIGKSGIEELEHRYAAATKVGGVTRILEGFAVHGARSDFSFMVAQCRKEQKHSYPFSSVEDSPSQPQTNLTDAGGFLKSILVSGWNIWTINSTGIKVFADEGQHLQAEQTMSEQQRHLGDAATLAAALRSKVSELQDKVSKASALP